MHRVLLLGAGKIGRMIARLLVDEGFDLCVADASEASLSRLAERVSVATLQVDASSDSELKQAMTGRQVVINALNFQFAERVAGAALRTGASYFDLTEDVAAARAVQTIAASAAPGQAFVSQCGLAPGFISIVAAHLMRELEATDEVRMRVGALPLYPSNMLKYNLTWSTDGLINEYCNPCEVIHQGERTNAMPLEGLEEFSLDGVRYEAFHTSGGLGTLCATLEGKVRELNYKTIRYPGHRELMQFLLAELRLNERRDLLKQILESAVPVTFQDVVVVLCSVTGQRRGQLVQLTDVRKIYSQSIGEEAWSGIQITTAASICAVVDLFLQGKLPAQGFIRQEQILLDDFLGNRFGRRYDVASTPVLFGAKSS